ncbi:hypothetical protein OF83DRAFT_1280079 [Amylostereum chailletii]|nr:hypothetical protein OF83DRAFT_1280079 [Amylostereum chailletii]
MATPVEPAVPSATLLLVGPVFIGALFSWLLLGISVVQLYIYHISFPHDRKGIQFLVYVVFALDIFLTVVAAAMGWHVLCAGWGRTTNLVRPGWTFAAIGAGDGITATLVQAFYAWRIYVLKKWRVLPILVVMIALAQLGSTLSIAAGIATLQDIAGLLPYFPRTTIWLGGGALADILIAASMVYLLFSAKKNSHALKSSDRVINRLIQLSIETGIITAASAIIELGLFLGPATKNTNLHLFFSLILGKIYSNTMMTSLNSRVGSRDPLRGSSGGGGTSVTLSGSNHAIRYAGAASRGSAPVVHIASHTEVFTPDRFDDMNKNTLDADDVEMVDHAKGNPQRLSIVQNPSRDHFAV